MTTIGFIGLGIMGLPMARNLVDAGFDVKGHNRSRERAELLRSHGGRAAASVAEAVDGADVVITMLPDGPDVEEVILGAEGVLSVAPPGMILVDMSTIHPAVHRAIVKRTGEQGVRVLDAPVSGGEQGAIKGALSIMVGGDEQTFEAVRPVLEAMGTTVTLVGGPGSGQTVKAANQLIVAVTLGAVAEALTMLEALGVETSAAVQVLSRGLAGSKVLDQKATLMLERRYEPGFRVALHHKDMGIALGVARAAGVVTPLAVIAAQHMTTLVAQGDGNRDHSSMKRVVDQLSDRQ